MFLICLVFSAAIQANSVNDPCESITGTWSGFWSSPYARSLCTMSAIIIKNNEAITVQAQLSPRGFPNNCNDTNMTIYGTCKMGKVVFQQSNMSLTGYIEGNRIRLNNEDEGIRLEKVS